MQNMYKPKVKRSSVEVVMGKFIIIIFGIQNLLCFFCGVWYVIWYGTNEDGIGYIESNDNEDQE